MTMTRNSDLVTGWILSPLTATTNKKWQQQQQQHHALSLRISRHYHARTFPDKNFRLYQDFTDDDNGIGIGIGDNGDEDDGNKIEYFDEFADFNFVVGVGDTTSDTTGTDKNDVARKEVDSLKQPSAPSSTDTVLQQRFQALALTEQVNRQQISDNWKEGYWGVWGCSLDPYTEDPNDTSTQKTIVTCIRQMPSPDDNDDYSDDIDGVDDVALLIVGRSDGSLCWLQMETMSSAASAAASSSSTTYSPSDNDSKNSVENRSITTYFENKLVAKATDDGGMVVDTALQRANDGNDNVNANANANANNDGMDEGMNNDDGNRLSSSPRSPFDILAQIQTQTKAATTDGSTTDSTNAAAAIVDMLPLPKARMIWTIAQGAPNAIQGWKLAPHSETGFLLPSTSTSTSSIESKINIDIETIHMSPIVAMKVIPKSDDDHEHEHGTLVVSISDNGQVVVWEVPSMITSDNEQQPSIKIRLDANLLRQQQQEEEEELDYDDMNSDSILSVDLDDQYLYLGSRTGRVSIFALSAITEENSSSSEEDASDTTSPLDSLPLVKSFLAFTSRDPGVSTLLAAGPGILGANNGSNKNRPPTKSLIAGNMVGELKQWELIPAGKGRLEYWPRMASQKLPGGKPHVYETRDYGEDYYEGDSSPAIRGLLCIQQVLLAATDHDLTVWDSMTGKALYDMQGLDFDRPNLVTVNDSVLVTNGMENFVCVHDFAMDRITSENAQDFLERDDDNDNDDGDNDDENDDINSQEDW